MPRAALGLMVGFSLGLAGAALQGLLRNPLADPGVIGVSGGAAFGAVVVFYSGLAGVFALAMPIGGVAGAIVAADTPYHRVIAAGQAAVEVLKDGVALEKLHLSRKEQQWLTRIDDALGAFPADEKALLLELEAQYGSLYDKSSYGL